MQQHRVFFTFVLLNFTLLAMDLPQPQTTLDKQESSQELVAKLHHRAKHN